MCDNIIDNDKNGKNNKGDEDMGKILDYPLTDNSTKQTGWRRMAEIAEQSMRENNYSIKDVHRDLDKIRDKY